MFSFLRPYIPEIMSPHTKAVQKWNKFFVISCLFAIFIDPLFFFLLSVHQFRLAYVAPESRFLGAGDLVDDPRKIALNYLFGYFIIDFFIVLPLPQRVNQCLRNACHDSSMNATCMKFISCGYGNGYGEFETDPTWRLEMSLRRRDVERWMSHRRLPEDLRRRVREAERFNWVATRGVNEEMLMEGLPEDLQREIRQHLFKIFKNVRIFELFGDKIMDAICERLRMKSYMEGSTVVWRDGLLDKMVFIIRGKMECSGENNNDAVHLSEGDFFGEELLTWCLDHSSVNKDGRRMRPTGHRLLSNRSARCTTNVEALVLRAADLEEVMSFFAGFLRSPRVQGHESPHRQGLAPKRIKLAWRYRNKRLKSF
ncbi:putative cyclic nucleotide-gated ion channel 20, chloroplastic-like [Dorcoceras hygrometricum]|nr:putative cyclic nucleotide-gated ion channel 20, chloroplastic-like [Dorcoceras hygrometricum]